MAVRVAAAVFALVIGGTVAAWAATPRTAPESDATGTFPRFEALRANKVDLRTGPGQQYPIEWVYQRRDLPVEVLHAVEHWRQIRDWEGSVGWVHEKMLWPHREAIVVGGIRALRAYPQANAAVVARAEPGVVAKVDQCQGGWCRIETAEYAGWVTRGEIFGVGATETVP
ncbi:MAG TPA: SH3 domain-containing protein [Stellaceae bacterium]|jgi:SH3-like domain-containing protein